MMSEEEFAEKFGHLEDWSVAAPPAHPYSGEARDNGRSE
jgi:hypothetical protein